jgi:hypothetical protein
MSELDEYHQNLMADIRREADASGIFPVEAFFDRMTDRLTEAGELQVADRAYFQSGEGGQRLRIDGYAGDPRDSEGVFGLIVCDFADSDNVQTFGKGDVPPILNPLIRFLKKAKTEDFRDSLNEANPAFQVSDLIITTWAQVTKVKLILVSNRQYIGRDDAVKLAEIGDVPITWSVWDLARFERFDLKGSDEIEIDLNGDFGGAIPALKASRSGDALESYLMIIPGSQLASIYDRWGEKLLQGNVRSFLQARAKTNKGIQNTIRNEPELFFPYNNGLSATANAVTCVEGSAGLVVTSISNLQIVNGAQTTGSLHTVMKTAAEQLQRVFVQMKLTVVPFDRAEEIVPRISEFANTQNKVNAADFFANHPFHVRMQDFSRHVIFARREGERHDTKWFYERARGQYINARPKTRGRAQTDFDIQFPKPQLFSKTDLAKFEFSAAGHPHTVSRGAQKNFAEFAKDIGETWSKNDAKFDELWYRRLISKAIVFRWLETEIPKQPWYEGGYRANIVTYAMAKVFHDAPETAPAPRQRHLRPLLPVQDRLDDVGREQRQAQDAGHVGRRDPLALGQFGDGGELARLQHPLPAERAGQRLDQRAVCPPRLRGALRQLHLLPPAALHDAERDVERHGLGDRRPAGHAAASMPPASISRARPPRPSTRSRTFSRPCRCRRARPAAPRCAPARRGRVRPTAGRAAAGPRGRRPR